MCNFNKIKWDIYNIDHDKLTKIINTNIIYKIPNEINQYNNFNNLLIKQQNKLLKFINLKKQEYNVINMGDLIIKTENKLENVIEYINYKKKIDEHNDELVLIIKFIKNQIDLIQDLINTFFINFRTSLEKINMLNSVIEEKENKYRNLLETDYIDNNEQYNKIFINLNNKYMNILNKLEKPVNKEYLIREKVYTIGCFDLFHQGHKNLLKTLCNFGTYIIVGIHDDNSYFKLKNKYPIDTLEIRINNIKEYVDQIYVIPATDPTLYIKSMISNKDIEKNNCCYVRGEDMLQFPSREYIESIMPIYFLSRTHNVSSTLIRNLYHHS